MRGPHKVDGEIYENIIDKKHHVYLWLFKNQRVESDL